MTTNAVRPDTEAAALLLGRATHQRSTVLRSLIAADGFVSAQALHARLVADGERVGLSTVYRTLTALADADRADLVRTVNGERLFRYRPGAHHLHYLLCRSCGTSTPVDSALLESWAEDTAAAAAFTDLQHTVELTGICALCRA
ncbi:Fur family transcriptional regulator [Streptacidiphilus sp. N1-3]|uniref:Fur family transcriptional regulator n=1 Tax=Streptacidiphilus alkalitolerans TaxID=3342712 RepID=A0ABV6X6M4_9ACTN